MGNGVFGMMKVRDDKSCCLPVLYKVLFKNGHDKPTDNDHTNIIITLRFCVAYTKCVATLLHDRIYLFVHESRAPITRSWKPLICALRAYIFIRSDEGLTLVTSAPPFYLTVV